MNDFDRDEKWAREVRDRVLVPHFYRKYVMEGRFVLIDKGRLAKELQRRYGDTVVQARDGASVVWIEEKIVRWPGRTYTAFSLETHSCTVPGHESEGWMRYMQADYLLYCFHQPDDGLICYLIEFPALQAWFNQCEDDFRPFGPLDTLNASMGKVVPIRAVKAAVWALGPFKVGGSQGDLFDDVPPTSLGGRPEGGRASPPF